MEYKRLPFQDYFTICSQNYCKIETNLKLAEYKTIEYTHKDHRHDVQYQVRYDEERNVIQCIFQQTNSESDWKANFEFPTSIYDKIVFNGKKIQLKAATGWGEMWLACQDEVRKEVKLLLWAHSFAEIEVFGWSLGSALAQLCAEDIFFKFGRKCHLFTFGSVKPFFGRETYNYVKQSCYEAYNFYDHNDIVGYMVPLFGYRAINHYKVKQDLFMIHRLFNPYKYHTEYYKEELYGEVI